jgi:hypothetical protein
MSLLAEALRASSQPLAICAALETVSEQVIGHRLFTIMRFDPGRSEVERVHSNLPSVYPVGGRKKKADTKWADHVLHKMKVGHLVPDHLVSLKNLEACGLQKKAIVIGSTGFTPEERELMQQHPSIGANILGSLDFLEDVVPIVFYHHERYDGHGYPAGMAAEEIPLGARIIAIADAYNAMTSDRPYRGALARSAAVKELRMESGSQFDPQIVDVFLRILDGDGDRALAGASAKSAVR